MATSAPVFTTEQSIQQLYLAYFNRPADAAGLAYWENAVTNQGVTLATVSADFAAQPEYKATYANMSNDQIINTIYHNLFNRSPDAGGLTYWSGHLTAGDLSINNIVNAIAASALQDPAQGPDSIAVESKVNASVAFTQYLNTDVNARIAYSTGQDNALASTYLQGVTDATSLAAAEAALPTTTAAAIIAGGQPAPTVLSLTTGVDILTATGTGANNFYGVIDNAAGVLGTTVTFGGADTITGAGTNNTLVLTDAVATGYDALPVGATISDIQSITLKTAGNAGNFGVSSFDVSGVSGLKSVTVNSTSLHGDQIKAAATTAIVDVSTGANAVSTSGGAAVTVTSAGAITVAGAAGSVKVTDTGATAVNVTTAAADVTVAAKGGAVTVTGATTLAVSATGAIAYATRTADTHAAAVAAAADADAGDTVTATASVSTALTTMAASIVTAGADASKAAAQADNNQATLTALTNGAITAAQKTAIDAAFATGLASSATLATAETAALAAALAVETPIIAAAAAAATAATAAKVTTAAALAAANLVVTHDTTAAGVVAGVVVTDITNTALTGVTITGNYGAAGSAITDASSGHNTLTSATLNNAGDVTLTGLAITNVTLSNAVHNVTIVDTTVAHADTFTLNAVKGSTLTDAHATTVNIANTGATVASIDLDATLATAVNVSGTSGVNFTGDTLAATAVVTTTVGGNTFALTGGGQSFMGGTTGDNTIVTGGLQTATVDGGTGGGNTLVLNADADFATTASQGKFLHFSTLELGSAVTAADVTLFTGSTITAVTLDGGTQDLTGLTAAQAAAITVTANDALTIGVTGATNPGQLDIVHLTVDAGDGGGSTITLTGPTLTGVETLNLTANDNVTIDTLLNSTALTNVNVDGAGNVSITTGALPLNVNSVIDAHAVTGTVFVDASAALANGLKIIGSATADNHLIGNGLTSVLIGGDGNDTLATVSLAGTHTTFTDGNGNNTITDLAGLGVDNVTVGDGINTITIASGTVVAGNGYNTIVDTDIAGANSVTVGTGYNSITLGDGGVAGSGTTTTGTYSVTLGAHSAAAGVSDVVFVADTGSATIVTAATTVVHGGVVGDVFNTTDNGQAVVVTTLSATQLATIAASASVAAAISAGSALTAGAHGIDAFVFGGNTYVVENVAAGTAAATSTVIELVGVHTIAASGTAGGFTIAS